MKVYAFLADGFEEIEAITPIDLLRRAGVEVCTVSIHPSKTVTGAHNMSIVADSLYNECDFSDADLLFLPGGMPGTSNLENHAELCSLLRKHNEEGKMIGLEPNSRICDDILCGVFYVVGQNHRREFVSLSEAQITQYSQIFANIDTFTDGEVEGSIFIQFIEI